MNAKILSIILLATMSFVASGKMNVAIENGTSEKLLIKIAYPGDRDSDKAFYKNPLEPGKTFNYVEDKYNKYVIAIIPYKNGVAQPEVHTPVLSGNFNAEFTTDNRKCGGIGTMRNCGPYVFLLSVLGGDLPH